MTTVTSVRRRLNLVGRIVSSQVAECQPKLRSLTFVYDRYNARSKNAIYTHQHLDSKNILYVTGIINSEEQILTSRKRLEIIYSNRKCIMWACR